MLHYCSRELDGYIISVRPAKPTDDAAKAAAKKKSPISSQ
jgi:hypothetical protein